MDAVGLWPLAEPTGGKLAHVYGAPEGAGVAGTLLCGLSDGHKLLSGAHRAFLFFELTHWYIG